MATLASSRQPPADVLHLTPPSSSHGARGSWDFAVPMNNRISYEQDPYMSEYATQTHAPRQPLTSQANGFAKPVRSTTWGSQEQYHPNNPQYLATDRVNELHKKASGDMSANSSEQDGVSEYYKAPGNSKKPPSLTKGKGKKKPAKAGTSDPNWVELEHDENNWIHRDKLKEIETRELEEAGFRVGRASSSKSRSQSATRRARDRTNSESTEVTQNGKDHQEPRKGISPIPAEDEEFVEYQAWSPTANGEVTQEFQPASSRTNHNVRPSTSRIPLPKTSGIPVPASLADRDAPLPRSRASSGHWNVDIAANGARVRSGSVGSQVLLDDVEDGRQRTPPYRGHARNNSSSASGSSPQKSPMKAKTPGKPNPTSGPRKTSAQKSQPKSRVASATNRPGTSGGTVPRPTTANRPEGEAPWIATMYKPDPRLPPDQQIIPTHAKRMQQEQWETQGRVGSMYDKDFRMLNSDEPSDKRLSQLQSIDIEKAQGNDTWPLPSPVKQQSSLENIDRNAATPTTEQGGYKLTPTIPQGARAPSPKLAPPIEPPQSKPTTTRVPESAEEAKEKKGCGCIVM